jgi:hypothetical protein
MSIRWDLKIMADSTSSSMSENMFLTLIVYSEGGIGDEYSDRKQGSINGNL